MSKRKIEHRNDNDVDELDSLVIIVLFAQAHTHSTATAIESESNGRGGESYVGHEHSPMNKCLTAPFQDSSIFPGWNQIWLGVISNPDEFLDDSIKLEK